MRCHMEVEFKGFVVNNYFKGQGHSHQIFIQKNDTLNAIALHRQASFSNVTWS